MSTTANPNYSPLSAILMEPSTKNNSVFIQNQILEGGLSTAGLNTSPPSVKRIARSSRKTGRTPLGNGADISKTFSINTQLRKFVPNPAHDPSQRADEVLARKNAYKLTSSITIGTFTTGEHTSIGWDQLNNPFEVSKNLYLQAEILKAARERPEFQGYKINVEESIYNKLDTETLTTGGLADLSMKGQAIGYNVTSHEGTYSNAKVFQLAEYLLNYPFYNKLILDYHTFSSPEIRARLFVVIPDCTSSYDVKFERKTETRFNGNTISGNLFLLDDSIQDRTVMA